MGANLSQPATYCTRFPLSKPAAMTFSLGNIQELRSESTMGLSTRRPFHVFTMYVNVHAHKTMLVIFLVDRNVGSTFCLHWRNWADNLLIPVELSSVGQKARKDTSRMWCSFRLGHGCSSKICQSWTWFKSSSKCHVHLSLVCWDTWHLTQKVGPKVSWKVTTRIALEKSPEPRSGQAKDSGKWVEGHLKLNLVPTYWNSHTFEGHPCYNYKFHIVSLEILADSSGHVWSTEAKRPWTLLMSCALFSGEGGFTQMTRALWAIRMIFISLLSKYLHIQFYNCNLSNSPNHW